MYARMVGIVFLLWSSSWTLMARAYSQDRQGETLGGTDSREIGQGPHGHLLGEWGGLRTHLSERGVRFDFQYVSDSLWNLKSEPKEQLASWNRVRGTVDIDFGPLVGRRTPFAHNPTGLVPQFRGVPVSLSEIGFSPGKEATSVRAFDTVESRTGYSGLYQFGASYNPGKFTTPLSTLPRSGNYLLYWMANQALWRVDPKGAKGWTLRFPTTGVLETSTATTRSSLPGCASTNRSL
jgi:hypothetical protein